MFANRDDPYLPLIEDKEFDPIFIIGLPRSGTTLLHHLLAKTDNFNYVNTYHVVNYDRILFNHINQTEVEAYQELDDLIDSFNMKDRGVDSIKISASEQEEYCVILDNHKLSRGLRQSNLAKFNEICRKITYISQGDKRSILLKSPFDILNFSFIRSTYPEAKLIFIVRHPINVLNSILKYYRSNIETRNKYLRLIRRQADKIFRNPFYFFIYKTLLGPPLGIRTISRFLRRAQQYYIENYHKLSPSSHIMIKYESLCSEPGVVLKTIFDFLKIEPEWKPDLSSIQAKPTRYLPEVEMRYPQLRRQLDPLFENWGYSE